MQKRGIIIFIIISIILNIILIFPFDKKKTSSRELIITKRAVKKIIGTIYTAESLSPKLKVYTYEWYKGIVNKPNLTYVIEMSDIYPNGGDGITTDMW